MPHKGPTLAERLRRHRHAFERALAEGITPAQAQQLIDQEADRARWAAAEQRLAARMQQPLKPTTPTPTEPTTDQFWWND